jgi:hypothetical protein
VCCIQPVAPGSWRQGAGLCQPPDGDPLDRFQEPPFASSTCRRPLPRRVCRDRERLCLPSLPSALARTSTWHILLCKFLSSSPSYPDARAEPPLAHWSLRHLLLPCVPRTCGKRNVPGCALASVALSAGSTPRPPFSGEQQGGRRSGADSGGVDSAGRRHSLLLLVRHCSSHGPLHHHRTLLRKDGGIVDGDCERVMMRIPGGVPGLPT